MQGKVVWDVTAQPVQVHLKRPVLLFPSEAVSFKALDSERAKSHSRQPLGAGGSKALVLGTQMEGGFRWRMETPQDLHPTNEAVLPTQPAVSEPSTSLSSLLLVHLTPELCLVQTKHLFQMISLCHNHAGLSHQRPRPTYSPSLKLSI